jgi:hypothetical protein
MGETSKAKEYLDNRDRFFSFNNTSWHRLNPAGDYGQGPTPSDRDYLFRAVQPGLSRELKAFLEQSPNINLMEVWNDQGVNPVHLAASLDNTEAIKIILNHIVINIIMTLIIIDLARFL